jgi:hypothetical protein
VFLLESKWRMVLVMRELNGVHMAQARKLLLAQSGSSLRTRAADAVRAGMEAILLTVAAFGVAQAAWALVSPSHAGARASDADEPDSPVAQSTNVTDSAFAPGATNAGASGYVTTLLAGIELKGLRTSAEGVEGGAILALPNGRQNAFVTGQEIAPGVILGEVGVDYVIFDHAGGAMRMPLPQAESFSYARARIGLDPAPNPDVAPAAVAQNVALAAPIVTVNVDQQELPAAEMQWLSQTLSDVQEDAASGQVWRVAGPLPASAQAAGLQAGDVIVAVDGITPGQGAQALIEAARDGVAALTVRGSDGAMRVLTLRTGAPA